tara:strand:- start:610 stop:5403 length:4794 start_codon:yes stop_codon:yes gene_type:complete
MSIYVERNHFYVKKDFDDVVTIKPQYGDLALTVGNTVTLGETIDGATTLNKVTRPTTPSRGDSEAVGAVLQVYSPEVDALNEHNSPELSIFRCNPDIPLTEGNFSIATRGTTDVVIGDKLAVYTSSPSNPFSLIEETFEGKILDAGTVQRVGNNTIATYSEPFMWVEDLVATVNENFHTDYTVPTTAKEFKYYRNILPVIAPATFNKVKIPLQFTTTNYKGYDMGSDYFWVASTWREGLQLGDIRDFLGPPNIYSKNKFRDRIRYNKVTTSTIDPDATPVATENTTIFEDIFMTRNSTNPYDATSDNPLIYTTAELSADNSADGGQSLRIYEDWSYSDKNNIIQNNVGVSGNLNPQMFCGTIADLPFPPLPFDIAQNVVDSTTTNIPIFGNHRGIAPEISFDMNIQKLDPAILLNLSGAIAIESLQDYYNDSDTSCPTGSCGKDALSFLRSVVVTFSSFKPNKTEHPTLDAFLEYGMEGVYVSSQRKVFGGFSIFKLGIDGNNTATSGSSLLCMPLTVTPVPQAVSGTAIGNNTIMAKAGMVKVNGSGTVNDQLQNSNLMTMGSLPYDSDGKLVDARMPQYVELPANSWMKLRIFSDPTFYNNSGSITRNPYSGTNAYGGGTATDEELGQRGSIMRVYFDASRDPSTTGDLENWDFIDIPFQSQAGNTAAPESWNLLDEPENHPRYMSIWVNNYCWVSTTDETWGGSAGGSDTIFQYGDNQVISGGGAREAEVFIDNIKFTNYAPNVVNGSANASAGPIAFGPKSYSGPIGTIRGTTGLGVVQYRKAWYNATGAGATLSPVVNNQGGGKMFNYNTGQAICFGFDSPTNFATTGTNRSDGYFLFNDFNTDAGFLALSGSAVGESDFKNALFADPTDASVGGAVISTNRVLAADGATYIDVPLGGQMSANVGLFVSGGTAATQYDVVSGSVHVVSTGAATANQICLGQAANTFYSTDGLRQKGFVFMSVNDATQYTEWTTAKRENILVSTKIMDFPTDEDGVADYQKITVADGTIFNWSNTEESYVIYEMGKSPTNANRRTGLKLTSERPDAANMNILQFTESDWRDADDGSLLVTEDAMTRLWIGPEKYWINMLIDSKPEMVGRSYKNIVQVEETPDDTDNSQLGSTYNEFLYFYDTSAETTVKSGLYNNKWQIRPGPNNIADFVIRGEDNGFGAYDAAEGEEGGGEIGIGALARGRFNYINIDSIASKPDIGPGQSFPIYFEVGGLGSVTTTTITTDNSGFYEKRPTIYWKYKDLPPHVSNLTVTPAYDLLDVSTNLYDLSTANLNAVRLNWEEENADDAWYKVLIVDDNVPIVDKYHKAKMWVPLNEVPDTPDDIDASRYKVHNPTAGTSGNCVTNDRVYTVLDGQAGWCPLMKQAEGVSGDGEIEVPNATNTALEGLDEFTLVVHWTPSAGDAGEISAIVNQTDAAGTAADNFEMYKDTNDKIVVKLGTNTTMTGTTSVLCDGEAPVNIILTYNSGSSSPVKNHLYINGVLDTSTITSGSIGTGRDFHIGAPNNGTDPRGTTGQFEEIIIYTQAHTIIDEADEYVYNTVDELDLSSGQNITHNARLFVFDYHNIRGTTPQEVGMSQPASWRATTL